MFCQVFYPAPAKNPTYTLVEHPVTASFAALGHHLLTPQSSSYRNLQTISISPTPLCCNTLYILYRSATEDSLQQRCHIQRQIYHAIFPPHGIETWVHNACGSGPSRNRTLGDPDSPRKWTLAMTGFLKCPSCFSKCRFENPKCRVVLPKCRMAFHRGLLRCTARTSHPILRTFHHFRLMRAR